jgi:hypothetical protein
MDFGGDDAATATELTGDEDRIANTQLLPVALGDLLGYLDLLESGLHSWPGVPRVGGGEGDSQQEDRIAIAASVSEGIVGKDSAEEHAIQFQP